jgi:hypothetical protein
MTETSKRVLGPKEPAGMQHRGGCTVRPHLSWLKGITPLWTPVPVHWLAGEQPAGCRACTTHGRLCRPSIGRRCLQL